ncbi:hypothetical protein RFI_07644, partial [Reticulomyxa filosa]
MLDLNVRTEEGQENKSETFSLSGCYKKAWISSTNRPQKLNKLICCLCSGIANNAIELQCDEHDNAKHVYLLGDECLQNYLKMSNGKCPIEQHDHCKFSKNKAIREQISELLVICPRQYDLSKHLLSNKGRKKEEKNELSLKSKSNCNFKGKIKDVKDHLDNSCDLNSIEQRISFEVQKNLHVTNGRIEQLQNVVKNLQSQLQFEKVRVVLKNLEQYISKVNNKSNNRKKKQINDLKHELMKKDAQIIELTKDVQQLKQSQIMFEGLIKSNKDGQRNQIEQLTINFPETSEGSAYTTPSCHPTENANQIVEQSTQSTTVSNIQRIQNLIEDHTKKVPKKKRAGMLRIYAVCDSEISEPVISLEDEAYSYSLHFCYILFYLLDFKDIQEFVIFNVHQGDNMEQSKITTDTFIAFHQQSSIPKYEGIILNHLLENVKDSISFEFASHALKDITQIISEGLAQEQRNIESRILQFEDEQTSLSS